MKIQTQGLSYQLVLLACIVVSLFSNYELTFLVWLTALLITVKKYYSTTIINYISIFSVILGIAIASSFLNTFQLFPFIRDFTYMAKPILGLLVGYQLCRFNSQRAFRVLIYVGLAIAIMHLIIVFIAFLHYQSVNLNLLRKEGGYFSDYEIFVIILLIFRSKFNIAISKNQARLILLIVGFSSFLYMSRTNMIQLVILYVGVKGYYTITKKSLIILSSVAITVLVGYFTIVYYNPQRGGRGMEAFFYKIKIAPEEAFKTRINKDDWKDFNDNYRSFENIITVKQVSSNGVLAVLFGEGLGSTLNLGRRVLSNDGEYVQNIPIVHNGFMTVFLKSGIVGVCFSLLFIIVLFRQKKSTIASVKNLNYLLIGASVFLIVSNWVFLGLYLKLDNKSIIIGFLIAIKELLIKENQSQITAQNE
jgi:hypothetical protein